ncbi:MAG: FkbM family methyltransferase [Neomegalonema sp.]|nr:FkbM family methyltransferase [Neomegalonema sp.]
MARNAQLATPVEGRMDGVGGWRREIELLGGAEEMRRAFAARWPALASGALKELAIVGAAGEGARLAELAAAQGVKVAAIVDDNPARHGARIGGCEVQPFNALAQLDPAVPVIVASHRPLTAIDRAHDLGAECVALFLVLQALDPAAWPPHMFYDGWFEDLADNLDRYAELDAALADNPSRVTLDAILGFRLTGDVGVLEPVLDPDLYAPKGMFRLLDDEVYVEGGAYDGDTIRLFIDRVKGRYARIIGFEPDPKTHQRLSDAFAEEPRVEAVASGLGARSEILRFVNDSSRGAKLDPNGDIEVPIMALDSYLGGDRVSFIKMNIEGAELDALQGAAQSIARWKPTMAISAYHRPTDLWRVPLLMRDLNPSNGLYLRQHVLGVVETVAYSAPF